MPRFSVDRAAVQRFQHGPEMQKVMRSIGSDIVNEAQGNLVHSGAVDTGRLYRSGFVDQDGTDVRAGFGPEGSGVDYAKYVNEGTGPHIIRAKPGGVLAFPGAGGETAFATEVHHPGTHPNPFLSKAALRPRGVIR